MLRRFNLIAAATVLLLSTQLAVADETKKDRYSIGVTSSEVSNDEAGAISIGTPFYNDLFQVKFSLVQAYKDGLKSGTHAWYGYQIYNLGVAFNLREVPGLMRVYAEGGLNYINTSASLSTASAKVGRYGLVGAELYLNPNSWLNCCSAYVEFGSTGKGVKADQLDGNPTIGHGFVSTVGLRYYF
ncbi:MAG: hypothetical protein OQK78_02020 [Gammaproteobacteria bacterium]|nr:hypothetical protein [Gammaproteobacteria bacterium]MCW8888338.1 hypothetical protein [Gammaproteobacteria bacterium]